MASLLCLVLVSLSTSRPSAAQLAPFAEN